jgi:uncharacterized hydrophobic protein (TIGR00271 family)
MRLFVVTVPRGREPVVQEALRSSEMVHNVVMVFSADGSEVVFMFRTHNGHTIKVIQQLQQRGVGVQFGYLDIVPIETEIPIVNKPRKRRRQILSTLRTRERLPVEAIVETATSNGSLSFDAMTYLVCACVIAALGLASDSAVVVVASMLVSPMMGPISLFCVALLLRSKSLALRALRNLMIMMFCSLAIGFIVAAVFLPFLDTFEWPTSEMSNRGTLSNLAVGAGVASASGIVVALTTTAVGVGPLIGVAISASLLPPVVNTGMLLNLLAFGPLMVSRIHHDTILVYAGISFLLFIVNITCIIVFSILTLYIKRVHKGRTWRFAERINVFNSLRWYTPTPLPTPFPSSGSDVPGMPSLFQVSESGGPSNLDDERPNPPIMAHLQE